MTTRLLSLDVVRGIAIAGMLLVNNPGSWEHIYAPLRHAVWHGFTPTELIFPLFIFVVGIALTHSLGKAMEQGWSRRDLLLKTVEVGHDGASLKAYIFTKLYLSWLAPVDASLLFAISYVLFWLAIMAVLYSKKIFIKL